MAKLIIALLMFAMAAAPAMGAQEYSAAEAAAWAAIEEENHLADMAEYAAWDAENAEAADDEDFTDSGVGCTDDCAAPATEED